MCDCIEAVRDFCRGPSVLREVDLEMAVIIYAPFLALVSSGKGHRPLIEYLSAVVSKHRILIVITVRFQGANVIAYAGYLLPRRDRAPGDRPILHDF